MIQISIHKIFFERLPHDTNQLSFEKDFTIDHKIFFERFVHHTIALSFEKDFSK